MVLVWWIMDDSPNFPPATFSCCTVSMKTDFVPGSQDERATKELIQWCRTQCTAERECTAAKGFKSAGTGIYICMVTCMIMHELQLTMLSPSVWLKAYHDIYVLAHIMYTVSKLPV